MGFLVNSPFHFTGELHEIHLFNFSLDPACLEGRVPAPLKPVIYKDRAWISLANVNLRNMRLSGVPKGLGVNYHHLAYRLLVDCPRKDGGEERGIYFMRSFAVPLFAFLGNAVSEFRFSSARVNRIESDGQYDVVAVARDEHLALRAEGNLPWDGGSLGLTEAEAFALIAPLRRAFNVEKGEVTEVEVCRESWPLRGVGGGKGVLSELPGARLEFVFKVDEMIDYQWLPAKEVAV